MRDEVIYFNWVAISKILPIHNEFHFEYSEINTVP